MCSLASVWLPGFLVQLPIPVGSCSYENFLDLIPFVVFLKWQNVVHLIPFGCCWNAKVFRSYSFCFLFISQIFQISLFSKIFGLFLPAFFQIANFSNLVALVFIWNRNLLGWYFACLFFNWEILQMFWRLFFFWNKKILAVLAFLSDSKNFGSCCVPFFQAAKCWSRIPSVFFFR